MVMVVGNPTQDFSIDPNPSFFYSYDKELFGENSVITVYSDYCIFIRMYYIPFQEIYSDCHTVMLFAFIADSRPGLLVQISVT